MFWFDFLLHSVDLRLKQAQVQLKKLKETNVFNCTFHIWYQQFVNTGPIEFLDARMRRSSYELNKDKI